MAVYVDNLQAPLGRMKMCHMIADSTQQPLAMADQIGVDRKWIQKAGRHDEHFDIAMSKRRLAVQAGAVEVSRLGLGGILRDRREARMAGSAARNEGRIEAMALHVYDGEKFHLAPNLETAHSLATDAISAYRDACDPEWSDSVEDVAVYEAPEGCAYPDEDGRQVLRAERFDVRPDPTGVCDEWCDYRIADCNGGSI